MQDRYAGDIGDFGKFTLLSEIEKQGLSIGINWYKTVPFDAEKNSDGRFCEIPLTLRECDPILADKLSAISKSENRSIQALEDALIIPGAVYYNEPVSLNGRSEWHNNAIAFFKKSNIDLVLLDPDNGFLVPSVKKHQSRSAKYCFYEEAAQYIEQGCSILVYNHRSRKPELQYFQEIKTRLHSYLPDKNTDIFGITFPRFSVRDYFAIARPEHSEKLQNAFSVMLSGKWIDARFCQRPLTMGASYSDYRSRFTSEKEFLRHYKALPEDIVREMINNDLVASTAIRACMFSVWKDKTEVDFH